MAQTTVTKALRVIRDHWREIDAALTHVPDLEVQSATQLVLQRLLHRPVSARNRAVWLTPAEVGRLLGASADSVRRWCEHGRLPGQRTPGGHWRIARRDLEQVEAFRQSLSLTAESWDTDLETQFDV